MSEITTSAALLFWVGAWSQKFLQQICLMLLHTRGVGGGGCHNSKETVWFQLKSHYCGLSLSGESQHHKQDINRLNRFAVLLFNLFVQGQKADVLFSCNMSLLKQMSCFWILVYFAIFYYLMECFQDSFHTERLSVAVLFDRFIMKPAVAPQAGSKHGLGLICKCNNSIWIENIILIVLQSKNFVWLCKIILAV